MLFFVVVYRILEFNKEEAGDGKNYYFEQERKNKSTSSSTAADACKQKVSKLKMLLVDGVSFGVCSTVIKIKSNILLSCFIPANESVINCRSKFTKRCV